MPNLVVPGFTRSGTTWLYRVLSQHPDVFLPYRKEIHFFDRNYHAGLDWYRRYFVGAEGRRYLGDVTPTYILEERIAPNIQRLLPDCWIIIVLRNPVTWLFSNYTKDDRERGVTETFLDRVTNREFLERNLYYHKVCSYYDCFPADRILVQFYEDLEHDPVSYLRRIAAFLDIDATSLHGATVRKKENPTVVPRSMALHRVLHGIVRRGRRLHSKPVDVALNRGRDLYRRFLLRERQVSNPAIDARARARIVEAFRDDLEQLSRLVGRDLLSYWHFSP